MIQALQHILNNATKRIIFTSSSPKIFCAGGDVKNIYLDPNTGIEFFGREFSLLNDINTSALPTLVIINGMTLGGGVGLAMTCKYRVATETTQWAMPETLIGMIPDVGASFYLNQLRGPGLGLYLGLTGERMNGADCFLSGAATHFVSSERIGDLVQELW